MRVLAREDRGKCTWGREVLSGVMCLFLSLFPSDTGWQILGSEGAKSQCTSSLSCLAAQPLREHKQYRFLSETALGAHKK